ncbi:TetR/AcrR family transcriptional regulator [Halalkalibacter krulwichiae]|uniref:DNA-binding transcriptional repressor AcrR n=1 Tax=Halalkalibacter krulwichiae TaxID=199441 RepID=A0A1X9MLC6_9BACI|nr:TetR/AcrR family transcriptional regulator [Halalkalibacter krulwichiae]ARK32631.1 DNA-binding transcriptional repressor AcrR [Halalkalibacter krulwichiae]
MTDSKVDPRIIRTRKLIMDSFIELSSKKEFKDITIKDITTEAMINRATFYYHFEDKYDLLENVLSDVLFIKFDLHALEQGELNEDAFVSIFEAITDFQNSLSTRCHRGYEETIARIIREQLEVIFYKMLVKRHATDQDPALKIGATMLSWGMYGASLEWRRDASVPPDQFIKLVIPAIMQGVDFGSDNENGA